MQWLLSLSTFTTRYHNFIWFLIFTFTLYCMPHLELLFPYKLRLFVSEAQAQTTEDQGQGGEEPPPETPPNEEPPVEPETPSALLSHEVPQGSGSTGYGSSVPLPENILFTGAATYSIPIEVAPGRKGMSPKISLVYNSYQGNGPIGVGWSIDMGSIQRPTKWGVVYNNNDYVAATGGGVSELISRSDWGSNYYGSKIEGTATKYYKLSEGGGWQVTTKDGMKYFYGQTGSSQQRKSSDPLKVFKWCLDKIEDKYGNYMTVSYWKDQGNGEIYLDRIDYTGNVGGLPTSHYVKFYYETRTDKPPMYTIKKLVKTAYRLKRIEVFGNNTFQRKYVLSYTYSPTTFRSLLSSVTTYGKDGVSTLPRITFNYQEGAEGFTFLANINDYGPAQGYDNTNHYPIVIGDFNGDNKTDFGRVCGSGVIIRLSDGQGGFPPGDFLSAFGQQAYDEAYYYPMVIGDFDGDGKTDVGRVGTTEIQFRLSRDPNQWTAGATLNAFGRNSYPNANEYPLVIGDFNGDGKTDVGRVYYSGVAFYLSTGTGWRGIASISDLGISQGYTNAGNYPLVIGDFNGDGRTDVGRRSGSTIKFYYATASDGWSSAGTLNDYMASRPIPGDFNGDGKTDLTWDWWEGWSQVYLSVGDTTWASIGGVDGIDLNDDITGDFNGDGKADVAMQLTTGVPGSCNVWVYLSKGGGGWELTEGIENFPCGPSNILPRIMGDFNGDGKSDIATVWNNGVQFYKSAVPFPDLLTGINNSIGGGSTIEYSSSSDYDNANLPFILHPVSSIINDDGRGQELRTDYSYEGGYYDSANREFWGFEHVTSNQLNGTGIESTTDTWFHTWVGQEYATLKGKIVTQELKSTKNGELHQRRVENIWTIVPIWGDVTFPSLDETLSTITDDEDPGQVGSFTYQHKTAYEYDLTYFNALEEHKFHEENQVFIPDISTHFQYETYTISSSYQDPWIVNKPTDITVKDGSGNIVSRKELQYESTKRHLTKEIVCKSTDGNPETRAVECNDDNFPNETRDAVITYDEYTDEGNLEKITDAMGYITRISYDTTIKTHVSQTSKCVSQPNVEPGAGCNNTHTTTTEYDLGTGNLTTLIPPHLQGTSYSFNYSYDPFGRKSLENRPDGGWTSYQYLYFGCPVECSSSGSAQYVEKREHIIPVGTSGSVLDHYTKTKFDGLGRTYKVESRIGTYGVRLAMLQIIV